MTKEQRRKLKFEITDLQKTEDRVAGSIWRIAKLLYPGLMPWHKMSTLWDCKKSPIGRCLYDHVIDRAHDDCMFCHDPEERK